MDSFTDSLIAGGLSDSMASTLTPSYSVKSERIDSDDTGTVLNGYVRHLTFNVEAQFDEFIRAQKVTLRQESQSAAAMVETCRKSTISFNFDYDNESDDIMTSVLAVMDKLKHSRLSEGIMGRN